MLRATGEFRKVVERECLCWWAISSCRPRLGRTLKLKARPESYRWLNAAAIEVNQVFNYRNQIPWQAGLHEPT